METLIGPLLRALSWLFGKINQRVVIKRIVRHDDKDLDAAYDLYVSRLPDPNERDTFDNIVRWLEECSNSESQGDTRFRDYLLVAKTEGKVCGMFYGTYYFRTKLLLIGYLVSDKKSKQQHAIVPAILRYLRRLIETELKECVGFAFEIEHYALANTPEHARRCRAREDYFRQLLRRNRMVAKPLAFSYHQPRLSLWDSDSKEEPQILFYGRVQPPQVGCTLPKAEVATVLDAIYNDWYGDCYEDDPDRDKQYRAYLRRLFDKTIASLPNEVPTDKKDKRSRSSQRVPASHHAMKSQHRRPRRQV